MKQTEVVVQNVTIVTAIRCDICKRLSPNPRNWASGDDVDFRNGYNREVVINLKYEDRTYDYDGCGTTNELNLDFCPQCFEERVTPLLESLGVDCTYRKIDV